MTNPIQPCIHCGEYIFHKASCPNSIAGLMNRLLLGDGPTDDLERRANLNVLEEGEDK